jgi:flagellar biosynthesis protein FliR
VIADLLEPGVVGAFGLYLVRSSALVLSAPVLGFTTGFAGVKIALSMALAIVLYLAGGAPIDPATDAIVWAILAGRELAIGLFLGLLTQLAVMATRVAGELVGLEMALQMSQQMDPESGVSTPLIARVYEGFFMLALFAVDGHLILLRALARTFESAPVGSTGGLDGLGEYALAMLADMLRTGLAYVAPVLVVLGTVSALIGLLARAVPQLNVLELSFSLRIVVALVAMFAFAPLLEPVISGLVEALCRWLDGAVAVLEA